MTDQLSRQAAANSAGRTTAAMKLFAQAQRRVADLERALTQEQSATTFWRTTAIAAMDRVAGATVADTVF